MFSALNQIHSIENWKLNLIHFESEIQTHHHTQPHAQVKCILKRDTKTMISIDLVLIARSLI